MSSFRHSTVAQQRRSLESAEFKNLSAVLPISKAISEQHLDKNTIVRLASTYIRLHKCINSRRGYHKYDIPFTQLVDLLDGFLICLSESYDILYVSENISLHLGLSQVEMTGNPFWMYINEHDHHIVNEIMRTALQSQGEIIRTTVRMKSTLTKRSSKETLKVYAGYKTLTMEISAKIQFENSRPYFVGFCQPHPKDLEEPYLTMHASKWNGQTYYQFIHVHDVGIVRDMHQSVLRNGSVNSCYYRLINSQNQYFYIESYAFCYTTRSRNRNSSEIVLMNIIIG